MASGSLRLASVVGQGNSRAWPLNSDAAANTRDGSDSTYAQITQSTGSGAEYRFSMQQLSLPSLAHITQVRFRYRARSIGSPGVGTDFYVILRNPGGNEQAPDHLNLVNGDTGNTAHADYVGAWRTTAPDGGAWTQDKFNQCIAIFRDNQGASITYLFDVTIDIEWDYRPSVVITAPTYDFRSNDNAKPTVSWQPSDQDGHAQGSYQVKVFSSPQSNPDAGGAAADSGVVSGAATSWTPANTLPDGNYWVYVRITDSTGQFSNWAASIFSVNTQPGIATVTGPQLGATITATDKPTYTWSFTDPGGLGQDRWQVLVFQSPQIDPAAAAGSAVLSSGTQLSSATSWTPTTILPNGTYYVYVRAGNNPGTERYSSWSSTVFTLNVAPPTTAFTLPATNSTLSDVNRPTFTWSFQSPLGYAQERWQILVFLTGQNDPSAAAPSAVLNSGEQFTSAKTWTPTKGLSNGTYYAYIRVADVGSSGRYSSWASVTFTVSMLPGAIPVLRVDDTPIDFPATSGVPSVSINVLHSENALDGASANFESSVGTWTPGINCTVDRVVDANFAKQGTAYLRAVASAAGQLRVSSGSVPSRIAIAANRYVTAAGWFRPNATARTVWVRIDWYNGATSLGTTSGPLYKEKVGAWIQAEATGIAPALATHCSMQWIVEGCALSEQHFMDAPYVRVTPNKTAFDQIDDLDFVWPANLLASPAFNDLLLPTDVASPWRSINTDSTDPDALFWHSGDKNIPSVSVPQASAPMLLDLTGLPSVKASYSGSRKNRRLYTGACMKVSTGGVTVAPTIVNSTAGAASATSGLTWTHSVVDGLLSSCVIVTVAWSGTALNSHSVSGVTYNGVAMTAISGAVANSNSGTPRNVQLYYILNPPAGDSDVHVTLSSGTSVNMACLATTLRNVNQSSPFGTAAATASASTNNISTSVNTSATSDLVFAGVAVRNSFPTPNNGLAYSADYNYNANTYVEVARKVGTGGSDQAGFQWTTADNAALVLVPIHGSADGTSTQDIGFTAAGEIDIPAMAAFCGSSPGRLHTLYNQAAAGGADLVEEDPAHQLLVWDGTSAYKNGPNNKPTLYAEDAARGMISNAFTSYTGSKLTAVAVVNMPSGGGGSAPGKLDNLVDDFTSQNGSVWNGYDGNPFVSGGQLHITPTSSYENINTVLSNYDFSDSSITIEVVQRPNQGSNTIEGSLSVQIDSGNQFNMLVAGTNLLLRERAGYVNSDTSVTWNGTSMKYWRIRHSSNTVYWETSPDGTTWTTRRSKTPGTTGALTNTKASLVAGYWGASETVTADFIVGSVNIANAGTTPRVVSALGAANNDTGSLNGAQLIGRHGTASSVALVRNSATRATQAISFGTLQMMVGKIDEGTDAYTAGVDGVYTSGATYNGGNFATTKFALCHTGSGYASVEGLRISELHVFDDAPTLAQLNTIQSNISTYFGTAVVPVNQGGGNTGGGTGGTPTVNTKFVLAATDDLSSNKLADYVKYDWGKATSYQANSWMARNISYNAAGKYYDLRAWKNGTYREGGAMYWNLPESKGKSMAWEVDYSTDDVPWMSPVLLTWYEGAGGRWPIDGEIDVWEIFNGGSKLNTVKTFLHLDTVSGTNRALFGPSNSASWGGTCLPADVSVGHFRVNVTQKHTARVEWIAGVSIAIYVDGQLRAKTTDLSYVPNTLPHRITMQQEFYGINDSTVAAGAEAHTRIYGFRAYRYVP